MITVFTFTDTEVSPNPLELVMAKVYQNDGLVVAAYSGPDGTVTFDLGTGEYELIVSRPGLAPVLVANPYAFEVVNGTNTFTIQLDTLQYPVGNDVLCSCSGYLYDPSGQAIETASLRFNYKEGPTLVSGVGILPKEFTAPIVNGWASVMLVRGATYYVDIPWFDPVKWEVTVPDRLWANLANVLFPVVSSVTYDPPSLSLEAGEKATVELTFTMSSGLVVTGAELLEMGWPVDFVSGDTDVLTVERRDNGSIEATAIAVGSTSISATRSTADDQIQVWADGGISGTLAVTVS